MCGFPWRVQGQAEQKAGTSPRQKWVCPVAPEVSPQTLGCHVVAHWTPGLWEHCHCSPAACSRQASLVKSRKSQADNSTSVLNLLFRCNFKLKVRWKKMVENVPFALLGVYLAITFLLIDFITCSMTPEPHVPEDLSFCLLCVILPSSVHLSVSIHQGIITEEKKVWTLSLQAEVWKLGLWLGSQTLLFQSMNLIHLHILKSQQ